MTRRKDGLYQEAITINGKRKYFYGHSKIEVMRKIRSYQEREKNGLTFEEVADEWWEFHEPTLGPITAKGYVPAIRRAKEYLSGPVREVTPTDINQYILSLARKQYARKTVTNHLAVVNQIMKYAVQNGYIQVNPAREIDVPKGLAKTPRDLPTSEEIKIIKNTTAEPMGMFAYWVMYTGCRRSELLALTWNDVDLTARTITINKSRYQLHNKVYTKDPKTESGNRVLPILDKLLEVIPKKGRGLVFPYNGEMYTERRFELEWNKYRKKYGINCTPHALRHCYATMLYEANVPVKDAQELLGHAQASTTQDIYTHIRDSQKQKMREALYQIDIV